MIINNFAYKIAYNTGNYRNNTNQNFYNTNLLKSSQQSDTFETSFKGKEKGESVSLASQIKLLTESNDRNQKNEYLNKFIDYETMILGTSEKDDVINSMQMIADAAAEENDSEILSKYIILLHRAIYPNTGIGQFVNCSEISKNRNLSQEDIEKLKDIINN